MKLRINHFNLTESMVVDAIKIADKKNTIQDKHEFTQSQVRQAIQKVNTKSSPFRKKLAKLTERQMIKAVDSVILKRKSFLFILRPFRKIIPKWLLVDIPMGFLDRRIRLLDFLDLYVRRR